MGYLKILNEELESISDNTQLLTEKQIIYNKGKRYGQVVYLSGGAGSGKGFASENFMEKEKFKTFDVDELKKSFLKISELKNKYPEIQNLKLKNPKDVFKLHMFIKEKGLKEKTVEYLLKGVSEGRLPNIMFDITGKSVDDFTSTLPILLEVGYNPTDIHLSWVLTNYSIAVKQNANRERVVPDDIMLKTHSGAAITMWDIIKKGKLPKGMGGGFYVILNNRENTIFYTDKSGNKILNTKGNPTIKSFKYLTVKESGKKMKDSLKKELHSWVVDNIPKSKLTQDIF
jgi:hypothetical protein